MQIFADKNRKYRQKLIKKTNFLTKVVEKNKIKSKIDL